MSFDQVLLRGQVRSGAAARTAASTNPIAVQGGEAQQLTDNLGGRWMERNVGGSVFSFKVAAVTLPVVANNLVSVCGIYNPPGSGKLLEIINTEIVNVLATTVVNGFGWYSSTAALSAAATFTTAGTARSRRMQDPTSAVARVYTAVTHSGTPSFEALIAGHGATTNAGGARVGRDFNGSLLIPPGILASVAATTAASTASGLTIGFSWAEIPA